MITESNLKLNVGNGRGFRATNKATKSQPIGLQLSSQYDFGCFMHA